MQIIQRLAIIFALNLLFYARTIKYRYVSDDIGSYKHPPKSRNQWHKGFLWFIGSYKMIPKYDHVLTILIHATNCCLIYLAFGANDISYLTAVLFAFNPANNNGSVWISGRGYILTLMSFLLVFVVPWLSPFFLFSTIWFGVGILNPLILLATEYWYLLVFAPFLWLIQYKRLSGIYKEKRDIEAADEDKVLHFRKLIMAIKTYGFYLTLAIIPFRICFYHSFLQSCAGNEIMQKRAYTLKDKFFWFGLVGICLTATSLTLGYPQLFLGFLWFSVSIAPFCNLLRINQECTERFLYFSMVGIMYVLANLIIGYPIAITIFITMYAVKMWFSMTMFRDDYYILEHSIIEDSQSWYAWHVRGRKRWDSKAYQEALIMWVMARMISPKEFKINLNIATVLFLLKKTQEAEGFLKIAEENIIKGQEVQAREAIAETRLGTYGITR